MPQRLLIIGSLIVALLWQGFVSSHFLYRQVHIQSEA
jgi:hypothetical protein